MGGVDMCKLMRPSNDLHPGKVASARGLVEPRVLASPSPKLNLRACELVQSELQRCGWMTPPLTRLPAPLPG